MNKKVLLIVGGSVGLCITLCCLIFVYLLWYSSRPEFIAELTADSSTFTANRITTEASEKTLTSQSITHIKPSDTPKPAATPLPRMTPKPSETPAPTSTATEIPVPSVTATTDQTETPSQTPPPSPTKTPSPTLTPSTTNTPSPTYTPSPTANPIEVFEDMLREDLGKSNRDIDRLTYVADFDDELVLQWTINDNLLESWLRAGAEEDVKVILRSLSNSNVEYSAISLIGTFELIDGFGNSSEDMILSASYFQNTVDRINWDNYYLIEIFDIADAIWFHQAFPD